jgi:hypothetical protein
MKFGTKVWIFRGGSPKQGTPGCRRAIKGTLVGAAGWSRFVKLEENDPFDVGDCWSHKGQIGHWSKSQVVERKNNKRPTPSGIANYFKELFK